jgi:hypothetical protein
VITRLSLAIERAIGRALDAAYAVITRPLFTLTDPED